MTPAKMHADEVDTSVELVQSLIHDQFPHWADLHIEPVQSSGTDNAMFRVGDDTAVRMPRIAGAAGQIAKEHRWLPFLAPHLPLDIPVPLARGVAGHGYPFDWTVQPWLAGQNATIDRVADASLMAESLAQFVLALQAIDGSEGPRSGGNNSSRGLPLATRADETHAAIDGLRGMADTAALHARWEADMRAPVWTQPPVWIHGDLQSGNLLLVDGRLSAVIDFGCLGVGDPACDLLVAWNLFPAPAREVYRRTLSVDDATWARGRGWAHSTSVIALEYYHATNPVLAGISRYAIEQVLADDHS